MNEIPLRAEVLVADDSVTTTAMLKMLLERAGYVVRAVHSGTEALEELSKKLPDLVLCDIEMPGLTGYEVLERFRKDPAAETIPFILVTSKSTTEDKIRGLDCGASDYVTKPFKVEELKARIRTHLRFKALQDEVVAKNRELAATQRLLEEKIEALRTAYQKITDHQARTRRALDLASKVQRGLIPASCPNVPGYRVASAFHPAEEVAGDFYDFIDIGDGRLGIAIGDVAGKGVAASLVMVLIRTLLRSVAVSGKRPHEVLERVNQLVIKDYGSQDSTTLFYGILEPERGTLTFSNGGHEFPLLVARDGKSAVELCAGGPFLGIFPKARFNEGQVHLRPADRVLLFTDGLYLLKWGSGRLESSERVIELLGTRPDGTLDTLMRELGFDGAKAGRPTDAKVDDITMVHIVCERSIDTPALGRVTIHNSAANLRETGAMVQTLARRGGLSAAGAQSLCEATTAVVENSIVHAFAAENTGQVEVSVERAAAAVLVRVVDRGRGMDEQTRSRALQSEGGLARARRLVDRFELTSERGRGTTIVLEKKV